MYFELKKKIREYKTNSVEFQIEPKMKSFGGDIWDYNVSLKENSHPFMSSYLDLSQRSTYELEGFEKENLKKKGKDEFAKECYGDSGIIANISQAEHVDSDWLNGVILAQEIITKLAFNKFTAEINTWHNGCQSGLLRGFHHFCKSSLYAGHKNLCWSWKGIDAKENKSLPADNILIGAVGNGDITVGGNMSYFSNKIKEEWKEGADIVFHDIYPSKEKILLSGVLSSIMFLNNRGYIVIRLPEPELWNTNVVNCILMMCMIFNHVNLWIPPWGRRKDSSKYYLIASKKKKTIYRNNYRSFLKILKTASKEKRVLKNLVHEDSDIKEWLEVLQNIRGEMMYLNEKTETHKWTELIMNNILTLTQKI